MVIRYTKWHIHQYNASSPDLQTLTFIKSLLSCKYTDIFKLYFIHLKTKNKSCRKSRSKHPTHIGNCYLTKLNLPFTTTCISVPLSRVSLQSHRWHWLARIFGLVITYQPGSLDPRGNTCTNHNETFYNF